MAITRELWIAYMRILFVEAAYWTISISMIFLNEHVLSDNILTEDLTIFITIFQVIISLSILLTLNFITKRCILKSELSLNSPFQHRSCELLLQSKKSDTKTGGHARNINGDLDYKGGEDDDDDSEDDNDGDDGDYYDNPRTTLSMNTKLLDNRNNRRDLVKNVKFGHRSLPARGKPCLSSSSAPSESSRPSQDSLVSLFVVNIPQRINLGTMKIVFPLSILYIGMVLLNNFCLKNVGVAFYFVSRSLTTVFNVTFTHFLIKEPVPRSALLCCGLIVFGFILGIDQENVIGSLSVIGVSFGVASSLFSSLFSIYTKKTLAKLDRNIWTVVLYNNINAIVLCTPLMIIHGDIQALITDKVISPSFWSLLAISGAMSFFISTVTNASIKYTSPLTHNISGTAKACLQTTIAVLYFHERKSVLWWISNIIILCASATYSRIRQLEMEKRTMAAKEQEKSTHRQRYTDNHNNPGSDKLHMAPLLAPLDAKSNVSSIRGRDPSTIGYCSTTTSETHFQQLSPQQQQQHQYQHAFNKDWCSVKFQPPAN